METEFYLHKLKWESFVKDAIDPGATREFIGVNLISRTFNALLKVHSKLLNHPEGRERERLLWWKYLLWLPRTWKDLLLLGHRLGC